MNLIETMRKLMEDTGCTDMTIDASNNKESISVSIYKFGDGGESIECEPTAEERTEKLAEDLREAEPAKAEDGHYVNCPKCGAAFYTTKNERVCPDCKKKSQQEATARYEAKKRAKREEMQKTEQAAKEIVKLGDENA